MLVLPWSEHHDRVCDISHQENEDGIPAVHVDLQEYSNDNVENMSREGVPQGDIDEDADGYLQHEAY